MSRRIWYLVSLSILARLSFHNVLLIYYRGQDEFNVMIRMRTTSKKGCHSVLKVQKIVIWQIKVFFKSLGVIKINFILLVQPSILQPYILQNISYPRIFSLKKGATLCAFCCWMKSSMRRRRILMMRHSRNISPTAKYTAVVLESYSLNLSVFSACRFAFVIQNCKLCGKYSMFVLWI